MKLSRFVDSIKFNTIKIRTEGMLAFVGTKEQLDRYPMYGYLLDKEIESIDSVNNVVVLNMKSTPSPKMEKIKYENWKILIENVHKTHVQHLNELVFCKDKFRTNQLLRAIKYCKDTEQILSDLVINKKVINPEL